MLAVEVLKIWMGRFFEHNAEVDALTLTCNGGFALEYELLNQELQSKYFQDQEGNQVQVSHWQEFMSKFSQDHMEVLNQRQKFDYFAKLKSTSQVSFKYTKNP